MAHFGGPFLFCVEVCDEVCVVTEFQLRARDHWACVHMKRLVSEVPTEFRFRSKVSERLHVSALLCCAVFNVDCLLNRHHQDSQHPCGLSNLSYGLSTERPTESGDQELRNAALATVGHLQSLAYVSLRVVRFCTFRAGQINCHRSVEGQLRISVNVSLMAPG
jgi:hypothetical protein